MNIYNEIDKNKNRTILIMAIFVIIVLAVGYVFSLAYNNYSILIFAGGIALAQSLVGFYAGDSVALSINGAKEIKKKDSPQLWNTVENLSIAGGLPMPKVYIIPDPAPNAFATGRDPKHASVAVTTGLLERLDKSELEGVIAHELSHIGNYDIRLMTIVAVLVAVIAVLSDIFIRGQLIFGGRRNNNEGGGNGIIVLIAIVAAILAPLIAMLVQLAISRRREYLADSSGSLLTRYPEGLASALEKIGSYKQPMKKVSSATAHLYISSPYGKTKSFISNLFSTHPPIEERVKILRGM